MNNNIIGIEPFHKTAKYLAFAAFAVSVTFTIIFNTSQASGYLDMILLAATGVIQDSSEVLLAVIAFFFWTHKSKTKIFKVIAVICMIISLSLVAWSITATWGGNNAMIEKQANEADLEKSKLDLLTTAIANSDNVANAAISNAEAMRNKAKSYSKKYNQRAKKMIEESQKLVDKASKSARTTMELFDRMKGIDQNKIASVNSAKAAFNKISAVTGASTETVSTTFLLSRATQLELIGIVFAIVAMLTSTPNAIRVQTGSTKKPKAKEGKKESKPEEKPKEQNKSGILMNGIEYTPEMIRAIVKRYVIAKSVPNGEKCTCPVCEKVFIKKRNAVHCSNKGKGNCADTRKNLMSKQKREYNEKIRKQKP